MTTPGTLIFVTSDGSKVFTVLLGGEHKWRARNYEDALVLAEQIRDAIDDYSVDSADVIDETSGAGGN